MNTIVVLSHWLGFRIYELCGGPPKMGPWCAGIGITKNKKDDFGNEYLSYTIDDRHDIRVLTAGTVLSDLLCYVGYKLGQHLDKDSEKKGKSKNGGNNSSNGTGSNNPKDVKA